MEEKSMSKTEMKNAIRDYKKWMQLDRELENPERLMEKEYHFDESCGLSLSDHITNLKT